MQETSLDEAWAIYREVILSPNSDKIESSRWNNHIRPLLGFKKICTLTTLDCLRLRKSLEQQGLSQQSIYHCLSLIRRVIRRAIEWGYIACDQINFTHILPKFDNKRARFLSRKEAKHLLDVLAEIDTEWHDIALFDLSTGLRRGEIFSIQKSHIDFNCHYLNVVDTKSHRNRIVPLNNIAMDIVRQRTDKPYPFEDRAPKIFPRAVQSCGFNVDISDRRQRVVFHTLRHTFASWLAQEGTPLSVISRLLGHSSIQLTMRYAHLTYDQEKQATNMLQDLLL